MITEYPVIGNITEEERDEIKLLYERQNGLKELFLIITEDNDYLYNRIIDDMGKTSTRFQNWWDEISKKYGWKSEKDSKWQVDFETCKIYLVPQQPK
jgi:CXXX repeat modification system protein